MITTFLVSFSALCLIMPACNWTKTHPKEVEAIENDLENIAENLIPGAPHGSLSQVPTAP